MKFKDQILNISNKAQIGESVQIKACMIIYFNVFTVDNRSIY